VVAQKAEARHPGLIKISAGSFAHVKRHVDHGPTEEILYSLLTSRRRSRPSARLICLRQYRPVTAYIRCGPLTVFHLISSPRWKRQQAQALRKELENLAYKKTGLARR